METYIIRVNGIEYEVEVEKKVNEAIMAQYPIEIFETDIKSAKELGATALFGEKYGEKVRVVKMGDYSIELCGGCHVKNTSDIEKFAIISYENKGSNTYRITASTKDNIESNLLNIAKPYLDNIEKNIDKANTIILNSQKEGIVLDANIEYKENKITSYKDIVALKEKDRAISSSVHELEKKYQKLKSESVATNLGEYENSIQTINEVKVLLKKVNNEDDSALKNILDTLANKYENIFMLIANIKDGKISFISRSNSKINASEMVKLIANKANGNGGGSNKFAQGAGKVSDHIDEVFDIIIKGISNG